MARIQIGLLGTGAAALEVIEAVNEDHPDFEIARLYGHSTAGKRLGEILPEVRGRKIADIVIDPLPTNVDGLDLEIGMFFSTLSDEDAARERVFNLEEMCASVKPTFSTASVWRYEKDSTILIPEVNYQQAERLLEQARARGWKGFIAPGPNCTSVGPVIALTAMGILGVTTKIYFDSKQAVSGAGAKELARLREQREDFIRLTREEYLKKWGDQKLYEANVRCKIPKEVDKVCKEIRLITGHDRFKINGLCHRVPTEFGHVVSIYAETSQQLYLSTPTLQQRIERFNRKCVEDFGMLYSSPQCFVRVTENEFGPEPLKEAEEDGGMCTTIGQLENLDGISGFKFDVLSHNLKKGAGKGGIQTAEYLHSAGYF